jgi:hypothetical protein
MRHKMALDKMTPSGLSPQDSNNSAPPTPPVFTNTGSNQQTDQGQPWNPPARWAVVDGKRMFGTHSGLVNNAERITRSYYDLNQEPEQLYFSLSSERLNSIISDLKTAGYTINSPAQTISAIGQLMFQSNTIGRTWDVTLQQLKNSAGQSFDIGRSGYGYKPTNADDLKAIGDKVAQQTLGRGFTEAEAQKFISAYQGMERGGNAPSIDVYAQKFAQEQAPKEAAGYQFLNYMNQIFNAYGGTSNV